jgi:pSer/pThr/pTyr-binding forkhead associated (FHA) protein
MADLLGGSVRLVIEQGPMAGQSVPLEQRAIVVGRGEASELRLPETGISRQHARFQPSPQGWMVIDLGSTNGTFVNGQRLPANQPYLLEPGDRIAIGSSVFVAQPGVAPHGATAEEPAESPLRNRPQPAVLVAGAVGLIVVLVGIVILLVTLLQPEPEPVTPTVAGPMDQIATVFPVPSGMQDVMTAVVPLLPSDFPFLPSEPTATPEAALPGRELVRGPAQPQMLPEPVTQSERGDVAP